MASKKRMIDPGIWTDPRVLQLSSTSLLVFIGMISHADDEGIIEADPDSLYFRFARKDISSESIRASLCDLTAIGLVYRYGEYAYLPNWFKHQNLKGRKPQKTKLRRPPEDALNEEYVSEWIETFIRNSDPQEYPVSTCYKRTKEPVTHQCATSDSPVTHQCNTSDSRSEVKGSEVNNKIPTVATKKSSQANGKNLSLQGVPEKKKPKETEIDPLYHSIKDSFLAVNKTFTNWGKEGKAIKGIIDKCHKVSPEDPETVADQMISMIWEMKNSGDKFYRDLPFTPSSLNSSGIWDRVAEQIKIKADDMVGLKMWEELDPYGVRGKALSEGA